MAPLGHLAMSRILSRLKVVGIGFFLGTLFSGCCTVTQLPSEWDAGKKFEGWLWFMSGPFCMFVMGINDIGHPFVAGCVSLGFIGTLLLFAHPLRPSRITAVVSAPGIMLWILASFFTIIMVVWGA
jgi:hypothetical protein